MATNTLPLTCHARRSDLIEISHKYPYPNTFIQGTWQVYKQAPETTTGWLDI